MSRRWMQGHEWWSSLSWAVLVLELVVAAGIGSGSSSKSSPSAGSYAAVRSSVSGNVDDATLRRASLSQLISNI